MNRSKKIFIRVFIVTILLFAVSCMIRRMPDYETDPTLPKVDGELSVPGLNGNVNVHRDEWGIPHIFTEDEHDLFFAIGYVQAQDRLWQIVFLRALAMGRMSEIFGAIGVGDKTALGFPMNTLAMDKRQRAIGINYIGEGGVILLEEFQPEILANLRAYCDGINAFIDGNKDRLPIEFQVLYYEPDHFTPADVIGLSRFFGWMLNANFDDELMRYALIDRFGEDMAWRLMPLHDSLGPAIVPKEMLHNRTPEPRPLPAGGRPDPSLSGLSGDTALRLAKANKAIRGVLGFTSIFASNNWVVGPSITETGTAMLANDPHLPHMQPSLSYLMHIKGAGYDAYGVAFPGQPFVVMGHTPRLSWGATVTVADTQDLFVETVDPDRPGKYLYKGEWKDFVTRKEVIRVRPGKLQRGPDKKFKTVEIEIRHSIHGPIISDYDSEIPDNSPPVALRWVGWDFSRDPKLFEEYITASSFEEIRQRYLDIGKRNINMINVAMMFQKFNKGRSIDDFMEGMGYNVLLSMNWVGADADGRIAYLPGGLVPIRKKGTGTVPVPGESGEYDWEGFIPLMEHPHAIDPARGYMATANNKVVDAEWYPYIFGTNYAPGWRAWRIEELIEKLKPISVDDMRRIQNDVYAKEAEILAPKIIEAVGKLNVKDKRILKAAKVLEDWNYEASIDSAGACIYFDTMSRVQDKVLEDEFKKKDYNELVRGRLGNEIQMWIIRGANADLFDNKKTHNIVEGPEHALVAALKDSIKWLSGQMGREMELWQWGKIHMVKWYHPMGFRALRELSVGPLPHPGSSTTVRNASTISIGDKRFLCIHGPVMRHIIDMGDPNNALIVIDGSESGQWLSPHYRDMHSLWYNSRYIKAEKRPDKIRDKAASSLLLTPDN